MPTRGSAMDAARGSVGIGSSSFRPSKFTLLVAEDDPSDRALLERLLVSAGLASVRFVSSGEAVIDYLAGRGRYAERDLHPYPHVLLLDLGMPGGSGAGVLQWMANHTELPTCSIYVLTDSRDPVVRRQAVGLGVAGFFHKPLSLAHISWILEDRMALI